MKKKYLALMMGLTLSLASVGTAAFAEEPVSEAETTVMAETEGAEEESVELISVEDVGESQDETENETVIYGEVKEVTEDGITIAVGEQAEKEADATDKVKVLKLTGEEQTISVTEDTFIARAAGESLIFEVQSPDEYTAEFSSEPASHEQESSKEAEATDITEDASENVSENVSEDMSENSSENVPEDASENSSENVPEDMSENSLENVPEDASESTLENASEEAAVSEVKAEEVLTLEELTEGALVEITLAEDGNAEQILVLENIPAGESE